MDEEIRRVSLELWDVLERVGVSERIRRLYRDVAIRKEILETLTRTIIGIHSSDYRFGSSCEGTTTPGMDSDIDMVSCVEDTPVINDIHEAPPGICLLKVADASSTRPGYVKLQWVVFGVPLNINNISTLPDHSECLYDCEDRVCMKHFTTLGQFTEVHERNGPADTFLSNIPGCAPIDKVTAYRSRTFPRTAKDSLLECVRCGWLTRDDVDKMTNFGILLVGVGHPSSAEKHIEWRVSFSLQERYLMFMLNPTQHKCYVLLKIIKEMVTSKPDVGKSITSYHCKTCLFRVITKTESDKWVPENLIECTMICLTELRQCVCDGILPNFFIKENNMFERRVHGQIKERLEFYLSDLLKEGFRLFYQIQTDYIGDTLRGNVDRYNDIERRLRRNMLAVHTNAYLPLTYNQKNICGYLTPLSSENAMQHLVQQLRYLENVETITEHTQEETKEAITYMKPVLHKLYAQYLASLAFSTEVHRSKHHLLQDSANHLRQGMNWDLMSGRLVYASILYRQGNMDMCCDLLERIEQNLTAEVESVCGCHKRFVRIFDRFVNRTLSSSTDLREIMESYTAVCTIFLPSHSEIIPLAFQYELFRSVGTPPRSRDKYDDEWYSWSVVDSRVYLYFMQYLVYYNQNKHEAKRIATGNLWTLLKMDPNLGHRETGYNLLGWICSQEGLIEAAGYSFLLSWMKRPQHNAAKWHMLSLIYKQFVDRQ